MRRQSIVAGCRASQTRIIRSSSIRAEWHASLTRIFLILSRGGNQTGYQTDQSSSRKIQRKEFPRRVLLLLLFERIFSRMIHCPRGVPSFLPSPPNYLLTVDFTDRSRRTTTDSPSSREEIPRRKNPFYRSSLSQMYPFSSSNEWNLLFLVFSHRGEIFELEIGSKEYARDRLKIKKNDIPFFLHEVEDSKLEIFNRDDKV